VKGSDKAIVLGVLMAVALVGFYLKVLSPKRDQAASLKKDVTELQVQIDEQEQVAAFGEQARAEFPVFYSRLVVLGKAVPDQADTASLMVQLNAIAGRTGVTFDGLELGTGSESSASSTSAASTATPSTSTSSSSSSTASTGGSTTPPTSGSTSSSSAGSTAAPASSAATPTPATEAGAASLPIGASVGPAGLPTMPYDLTFSGTYFDAADFLAGVDHLVDTRENGMVSANGRLMTIDGFALEPLPDSAGPNPKLKVTLSVTSYVTPATEGLTLGASPTAPAPSPTQPQTQPASATVAQ
jgi:Tfp pilus assembly protein PilO